MTTTLDHRPAPGLTTLAPIHPAGRTARPASGSRTATPRSAPRPDPWERNGDRRDRLHLALSELFAERGDLGGVSVVADVLAEDLLWSA